jgi:hypothetical protein
MQDIALSLLSLRTLTRTARGRPRSPRLAPPSGGLLFVSVPLDRLNGTTCRCRVKVHGPSKGCVTCLMLRISTTPSQFFDSEYWYDRAEEARVLAEQMVDETAKQTMLMVAEDCDSLLSKRLHTPWESLPSVASSTRRRGANAPKVA